MRDVLDLLGRLFISFIFLFEAYDSIVYFEQTKDLMTEYGITWQQNLLLVGAIILLVTGGIFLAIGYRVGMAVFLLMLYWIPVTFIVHSWWNDPIEVRRLQSILFMKNIAILGGMLIIYINGSARYSVRRLLGRYKVRNNVDW